MWGCQKLASLVLLDLEEEKDGLEVWEGGSQVATRAVEELGPGGGVDSVVAGDAESEMGDVSMELWTEGEPFFGVLEGLDQ
jgi:hypothetical protein